MDLRHLGSGASEVRRWAVVRELASFKSAHTKTCRFALAPDVSRIMLKMLRAPMPLVCKRHEGFGAANVQDGSPQASGLVPGTP